MTDLLISAVVCALLAWWIVRMIYGNVQSQYNWKPLFVGLWVVLMVLVYIFGRG